MVEKLKESDWTLLLTRIQEGRCTPFLGAGAAAGVLPLGSEIARDWSQKYQYPMPDQNDLGRVAQFLALEYDPSFPRDRLIEIIKAGKSPDFNNPSEPHNFLSKLPLPIYMTTNYDDFMMQALKRDPNKKPLREYCRWNIEIPEQTSVFDDTLIPSKDAPIVFHLHGHDEMPESMVLTEDDYLDFLVNVSRNPLPPQIQKALNGASLLFIGYSLSDWSFRVLFRGLINAKERNARFLSVTVQLPPTDENLSAAQSSQKDYLDQYFGAKGMRVYWGTAQAFVTELQERWERFTAHPVLTTATSTQPVAAVSSTAPTPTPALSTVASEQPEVTTIPEKAEKQEAMQATPSPTEIPPPTSNTTHNDANGGQA